MTEILWFQFFSVYSKPIDLFVVCELWIVYRQCLCNHVWDMLGRVNLGQEKGIMKWYDSLQTGWWEKFSLWKTSTLDFGILN